jgi:wingless-type MMTV integration site family, member 10
MLCLLIIRLSRRILWESVSTFNLKFEHLQINLKFPGKCHGLSGSCQLKTCWKSSPDFRTIGKILKQNFRNALQVDQSNLGNKMVIYKRNKRRNVRTQKYHQIYLREDAQNSPRKRKKKKTIENSLLFFQKSPNFCERDLHSDIPGKVLVSKQQQQQK